MIPNLKAVVSIGLLVIAGTVQAATTFISTCPFVITSPGDYLLSADLGCSGGGTGILIISSHVTLKLEGQSIFASIGGNTSAISNSSDGVTGTPVTDVHILGPGLIFSGGGTLVFTVGVSLVGSVTDSEVSGITVEGSTSAIEADGQVSGTTGLTFTKNTVARGTVSISMSNVTSSTISENVATGYTIGIEIDNLGVTGGPPIKLNGNIVIGNGAGGLSINGGFVTAQNNIASGNTNVGIAVVSARSVEIINNTALANGTLDLYGPDLNCVGTVWSGNTFLKASQSCIH